MSDEICVELYPEKGGKLVIGLVLSEASHNGGVIIEEIDAGSLAATSNLQPGDQILSVNEQVAKGKEHAKALLSYVEEGRPLEIRVRRLGLQTWMSPSQKMMMDGRQNGDGRPRPFFGEMDEYIPDPIHVTGTLSATCGVAAGVVGGVAAAPIAAFFGGVGIGVIVLHELIKGHGTSTSMSADSIDSSPDK